MATEVPVGKRKAPEVVTIPLEAQAGVRFSMLAAANKRKAEILEAKAAASETMKKRRVSYGSRGNKLMPVNELASIGVIGVETKLRLKRPLRQATKAAQQKAQIKRKQCLASLLAAKVGGSRPKRRH